MQIQNDVTPLGERNLMTSDPLKAPVVTGKGYETHGNSGSKWQSVYLTPYATTDYTAICAMAKNPPTAAKDEGQWIIPSQYNGPDARSHDAQREKGRYPLTWFDFDLKNGEQHNLDQIVDVAKEVLGDVQFQAYTTRGATAEKQKTRIIVPLAEEFDVFWFSAITASFNDAFAELGLTPDPVNVRPGQVCYLPNRGEFYKELQNDVPTVWSMPKAHRQAFADYIADIKAKLASRVYTGPRDRDPWHSLVDAFNYYHDCWELLVVAGFETKNGRDYWYKNQSSNSYATTIDADGHGWVTSSDSVEEQAGRKNGDAYQLFTKFVVPAMNAERLKEGLPPIDPNDYPKQLNRRYIDEANEAAGLFIDWENLRVNGVAFGPRAVNEDSERILREEAQHAAAIKEALSTQLATNEWSGPWQNEVPFEVDATVGEWLAWHAPGMVGKIVRHHAHQASRKTLVPVLAGALLSVGYLGQGKIVMRNGKYATPCGFGMILAGMTGASKGDAPSVFNDIRAQLKNTNSYHKPVKKFKSGAAVSKYFGIRPDQLIIQNEAAADRTANKGDRNYETMISDLTDAMTGFEQGIHEAAGASEDTTNSECPDPSVMALLAGTTERVIASYSHSDAESGYLGRWIMLHVPEANLFLDAAEDLATDTEIERFVHYMEDLLPPVPGTAPSSEVYTHKISKRQFHIIRFDEQAWARIRELQIEFDKVSLSSSGRPPIERAIYKRAAEMVVRVSVVLGVGCMTMPGFNGKVGIDCVNFAELLVKSSIGYIAPAISEGVKDQDNPSVMVEAKVRNQFAKLEDEKTFKSKGGKAKKTPLGMQFQLRALKRAIIGSNPALTSAVVNREIDALIENEVLVKFVEGNTTWLAVASG